MAFQRVLAINELVEMIAVNLDVESLLAARRASAAFRNQALAAPSLRRKLLISASDSQAFLWNYHTFTAPNGLDVYWTVEKATSRIYDSRWKAFFTIKTPNPAILKRTHQPEYYSALGEEQGINQPEFCSLLIALFSAKERVRRPFRHSTPQQPWGQEPIATCLPGIDRLDFRLQFFPAELDTDSIYYDMFLFYEHTPKVTVHYQLKNTHGHWWGTQPITNQQGVRVRDVIQLLRWKFQGCDTGGEWAVQISVDDTIFPSEMEMAMVDDGDQHEEWVARHD